MRHNSVVLGYSKSVRIPWIDGLSTGPPGFRVSQAIADLSDDFLGLVPTRCRLL